MPVAEERIDEFLNHLRVEKGLAILTLEAYARDIQKWVAFLALRKKSVLEAERADVKAFLLALSKKKLDAKSVARNLVAVRQLYKFFRGEGHLEVDPTKHVDSP